MSADDFEYIYANTDGIQEGSDGFMGVHRAMSGEIDSLESDLKNNYLATWLKDSESQTAFTAAFTKCRNDLADMLDKLQQSSGIAGVAADMYQWTERVNASQYL